MKIYCYMIGLENNEVIRRLYKYEGYDTDKSEDGKYITFKDPASSVSFIPDEIKQEGNWVYMYTLQECDTAFDELEKYLN